MSAPRGCLLRGVSALGGCVCSGWVRGCLLPGGVCYRGCLLPGGICSWGVSAPGGSAPVGGSALVGGGGVSQHALRQTPSPPVDRILDTRL